MIDAGVAATPTTGVLVRQLRAAGGIQISASHNPPQYNGLKLFSAAGRVIPEAAGANVLARYRAGVQLAAADPPGRVTPCADTLGEHLSLVAHSIDVERIRRRKFAVLLDANHGAGSLLGANCWRILAARSPCWASRPTAQFEHPPEPTAENLAGVLAAVARAGADVGFCQDPDADRLAVIDAAGRYLGEEYTLAMASTIACAASAGRS